MTPPIISTTLYFHLFHCLLHFDISILLRIIPSPPFSVEAILVNGVVFWGLSKLNKNSNFYQLNYIKGPCGLGYQLNVAM